MTLTAALAYTLALIVLLVHVMTMGGCALLAGGAARWLRTPARLRLVNRTAGGTMIGAGALIVSR